MDTSRGTAEDQKEIWSGTGGEGWVVAEALLDQTYKPLEDLLTDAVETTSAGRLLDVGCGTGATTVAAARRLGPGSRCLGIDISEAMVTSARARAAREGVAATFTVADAETHEFDPASVAMIISRFGVMFFTDPVRGFANLRRAADHGAELRCVTWRGPEDNPFMIAAEEAAGPLLPRLPKRAADEPGQFGLAGRDRIERILTESGWSAVDVAPLDVPCAFPASALDLYLSRLGPVGRALQNEDEDLQAQVLDAVRPAFDRYVDGAQVHFTAACWMIGARAGDGS